MRGLKRALEVELRRGTRGRKRGKKGMAELVEGQLRQRRLGTGRHGGATAPPARPRNPKRPWMNPGKQVDVAQPQRQPWSNPGRRMDPYRRRRA